MREAKLHDVKEFSQDATGFELVYIETLPEATSLLSYTQFTLSSSSSASLIVPGIF